MKDPQVESLDEQTLEKRKTRMRNRVVWFSAAVLGVAALVFNDHAWCAGAVFYAFFAGMQADRVIGRHVDRTQ